MCGILGIIGTPYAAKECYLGLMMLQHRGQDSAGITSYNRASNSFHSEKNMGHVKEAIQENILPRLSGEMAISHTRYSTIGLIRKDEIQPMCMNYPFGLSMVHNGQVSNSHELTQELFQHSKRMLLTQNDLEILMNVLAEKIIAQNLEGSHHQFLFKAVEALLQEVEGGYSCLTMVANFGMLAFKDPHGIRPLVMGVKQVQDQRIYGFASESKTLEFLDFEKIEELAQGEVVFVDLQGNLFRKIFSPEKPSPCMFEWIYFANADSTLWNKNVYQLRLKLGELLAENLYPRKEEFDIVVPVPDTSRPSAIMLSEKLNLPYREVLIKNRYAQRTFILNQQKEREKAVHLKLNVVQEEVKGKRILLVDDSIVRGTTSKHIIKLLRQKGAKTVSLVSTCPPIKRPCFYGIDFPEPEALVAHNSSPTQIANQIGANEIFYLSIKQLTTAFGRLNTCQACLGEAYPTAVDQMKFLATRIKKDEVSRIQ